MPAALLSIARGLLTLAKTAYNTVGKNAISSAARGLDSGIASIQDSTLRGIGLGGPPRTPEQLEAQERQQQQSILSPLTQSAGHATSIISKVIGIPAILLTPEILFAGLAVILVVLMMVYSELFVMPYISSFPTNIQQ